MRRVWQAAAFPMVFAIVVLLLGSCFVLGAGTNDTNSTTTSNNRPEEPRRALVWPAHALHNTLTIQRFGLFSRVALDTTVSSEYSVLPQHYWIWLQVRAAVAFLLWGCCCVRRLITNPGPNQRKACQLVCHPRPLIPCSLRLPPAHTH